MKAQRVILFSGALLTIVGLLVSAMRAAAHSDPTGEESRQFVADGFQADASSALLLQGDPIGRSAVWRHVRGPVVGDVIGMIPALGGLPPFDGAACRTEYSENEIVAGHGGTLAVTVWGFRCEPNDTAAATAGAHFTNGLYSIQRGTGRFHNIIGGTGSIQIDARSDGSVLLRISGSVHRIHDQYKPF
jgi:hypothetical protein